MAPLVSNGVVSLQGLVWLLTVARDLRFVASIFGQLRDTSRHAGLLKELRWVSRGNAIHRHGARGPDARRSACRGPHLNAARAETSAQMMLTSEGPWTHGFGHLQHMPSHTFVRLGQVRQLSMSDTHTWEF